MSLRTVADETPRLCRSTSDFEPIGSLVATKSATIARSTSKRRSSAVPISIDPPNPDQFTGITSNYCPAHATPAPHGARDSLSAWPHRAAPRRIRAADDLQGCARRQAVPRARLVLPGLVADSPATDPARRIGHHHDRAGA